MPKNSTITASGSVTPVSPRGLGLSGYNTAFAPNPLSQELLMARVLLIIGDAAEVLDTMYPLFRIREEGHECIVAGPEKRVYHLVQHEAHPDWDITVESPGYHLAADIAFRDVKVEEYRGMVISGGRAPEYLRYDMDLLRLVRALNDRGLPIGSVCHGIEIVAAAGILKGRTATTVAKCRLDAEQGGGTYVNQ